MTGLEGCPPRVPRVEPESGAVALRADLSIFAMEAILRTAYKLTDRCHLFVEPAGRDENAVIVTFRPKAPGVPLDAVVGDFANELIDQQLREQLAREAGAVRELLVAQAFSEGNLLDSGRAEGDYAIDPEGVGTLRGKGPLSGDDWDHRPDLHQVKS